MLNTSSASWSTAIFDHPNFSNSLTRVGLCTVADGWVRNNVGNLALNALKNTKYSSAKNSENIYTNCHGKPMIFQYITC